MNVTVYNEINNVPLGNTMREQVIKNINSKNNTK